jgi:RHS repeat-associated protein
LEGRRDCTDRYKYDCFGSEEYSEEKAGFGEDTKRFTGKEIDLESGLQYFGARYYDPLVGRWTGKDQIFGKLRNPQSLNRYSYCFNNPLNGIDPDGKFVWLLALAGGIAAEELIAGGIITGFILVNLTHRDAPPQTMESTIIGTDYHEGHERGKFWHGPHAHDIVQDTDPKTGKASTRRTHRPLTEEEQRNWDKIKSGNKKPEEKPSEQKPPDPKPPEQKPADQKPPEQKPAEQKPLEQKPPDNKPSE